ncbi:hypothetical protein [Cerasicoccus maritimus]|uniref:hypothetical protein n=1 Tax=Cerasicoccus maritimus TaxID=490089 RepID=UPI002852BDE4|nr:hypothetical protein [Cerasicoccus maritimus]
MKTFLRVLALGTVMLSTLTANAIDAIDKQVVVDFLNARRGAYLSGDPAVLIQQAAPDISVTLISSVVEGPAGTRSMRLPQYVPFLKESFANTEYYAYNFKGVKAQIADDKQSAKVFVDIEEDARVQGLPIKADKALIFSIVIDNAQVKVSSLIEKIESVNAGVQVSKKKTAPAPQSSSGSGQSTVKIGD